MISEMKTNTYCMLIHLSLFLGIVVTIVLWIIKKDQDPLVNKHGKIVINWFITARINIFIGFILIIFALVIYNDSISITNTDIFSLIAMGIVSFSSILGVLLLVTTAIASFVFPIIGGIRANNGIVWEYPLSIPFFK